MFAQELQYWKIPNPNFAEKKLIASFPEALVNLLASEPKDVKPEPLIQRWRSMGPISLIDIMKKALPDNPIIFENEFGSSQREFKFDIRGQLAPKNKNVINGLGRANYGDLIYEG